MPKGAGIYGPDPFSEISHQIEEDEPKIESSLNAIAEKWTVVGTLISETRNIASTTKQVSYLYGTQAGCFEVNCLRQKLEAYGSWTRWSGG